MFATDLITLEACSNKMHIQQTLERCNTYIVYQARKRVPHTLVPPEVRDLELDELAQNVRIKLWRALQKEQIADLYAYIRRIVQNESIDLIRKYKRKRTFPLPLNPEGELYEGNAIVSLARETQDPEGQLESKEALSVYMTRLIKGLRVLPSRQRHALICSLMDRCADILPLLKICTELGMDIETVRWPEDKSELQRLQASLSVARRKLRVILNDSSPYPGHLTPSFQ